jgi:plastocyanin
VTKRSRTRRWAGASATLVLLVAGCGQDKGQFGTQPPGGSETATEVDGIQVLDLSADDDLKFSKTDLFAHTGTVKIIFKVLGDVPHNLAFKDGTQASTGTVNNATTSMTVRFDKPGVYNFLCTIHPYMKGTLTIS